MKKKTYRLLAVALVSSGMLVGCRNAEKETAETEIIEVAEESPKRQIIDIGESAPTFKLESIKGETYRLDELRGKPVLLNFFSVNCDYCRSKMPDLNRLYLDNRENAGVLLINAGDSKEQIEKFQEEFNLDVPILLDEDVKVSTSYLVSAVPYTIVIDKEGVINTIRIGPMSYNEMKTQLDTAD